MVFVPLYTQVFAHIFLRETSCKETVFIPHVTGENNGIFYRVLNRTKLPVPRDHCPVTRAGNLNLTIGKPGHAKMAPERNK